jgi:hypothetical protein
MKHKKIFIPVTILVQVNRKISPGRTYRQLVLEADTQCGAEVFEILIERIGQEIETNLSWSDHGRTPPIKALAQKRG